MADLPVSAECPFIVFKLGKVLYTINSADVLMIMQMPLQCESMPEAPAYVVALVQYQGEVIPALDLRTMFNMPSLSKEYDNFVDMIDTRKREHVAWAEELENCIAENRKFGLTTDPHKCNFGKWYDSFKSDNNAINFHLRKIDEPHKNLHQAAAAAIKCTKQCDSCTRDECLSNVFKRVKREYVPRVISLLDESKEVMKSGFHEMLLIISYNSARYALVVDEVLSVGMLHDVGSKTSISQIDANTNISSVKSSEKNDKLILEIDYKKLLSGVSASATL